MLRLLRQGNSYRRVSNRASFPFWDDETALYLGAHFNISGSHLLFRVDPFLFVFHMKEPTYEQMMKYILLLKSMEAAGMELNEQQKNILRMCKEKGVLKNNPEKALEGKDL